MPGLIDQLRRAAAGSSVQVLENDELILDGVRFLGFTLSDFDFDGPERRAEAMRLSPPAWSSPVGTTWPECVVAPTSDPHSSRVDAVVIALVGSSPYG